MTTTSSGYGWTHQQLRAKWAPTVAAGGVVCARCGAEIRPWQPWDLGHADGTKRVYVGPEHRRCNRATKGRTSTDPTPKPRTQW